MMMFSAPSPAPPTVLRSTAGLSGLIVPYSLPVSDGAAVALGDAAAGADADGGAAARRAGPPPAVGSASRIFPGRTVNVPGWPTIATPASPRSRFDVPTNPATNGVAGRS